MNMFNGKKHKVDLDQTDTLIGRESVFEGSIKSNASIRIEGKIHGDIECAGDCIVGEEGMAYSNIRARNVSIAGKVEGNIIASEKLTILSTGELHGNISTNGLMIEEGGRFSGNSDMTSAKSKKEENSISYDQNSEKAG